ncbi:hypothetical protein O1611_g5985 [Lasiodiplodia mahajangana]|uniref:Uncharacterized protein n=1 Tax=Lasiodiplodia mahajangana TaxID=1108764 RepID=A0ACC2JJP7_9PEZI|nr:hypothetical protein O1611_g5985 [Lasiodiplodia mahajangana]
MYAYNTAVPSSPSPGSVCPSEADYSRQGTSSPTTQQAQTLAIHIDMHDPTYMPSKNAHMEECLSVGTPLSEDRHSSVPPSSAPYGNHDMTRPYTSVAPYSPYSVPAYDSSLPTPVSVAGSPPMPERSIKMLSNYHQHGGDPQQLTPPTNSRPWPYATSMASVSSASMTVPSTTAEMLEMQSLESSHSPEHHTAVVDPTTHYHWSTYGVSSHDPAEELSPPHLPSQSIYSTVPPSLLVRSSHYGLNPNAHIPLDPSLTQGSMPPHHTDPRQLMAHDLHHQFDNLSNISLEYGQAYPARKSSKARTNRSGRQPKRGRNCQEDSTSNSGMNFNADAMTAGASNLPGNTPPKHLTLDPKAPEDSKYLVEMRCQMSDDKGKGMWEHIQQAYKERYGRKTKENLQMQLIRSVQSYAIWPEEEDQALKAAVEEYERRRYQEIRKIMKEKGGRRVWDWNDGSIAKRLVQMGVDEIDDRDPVKRTRRKRKSTVRQKSGGEPWVGCVNIQYNSEPRELTAEENNMLLETFCKTEPESPQSDQPMIDQPATSSTDGSRNSVENKSARVAKHACDQILANQGEHLYNGHNRYMS